MANRVDLNESLISGTKREKLLIEGATGDLVAFFVSKAAILAWGPLAWITSAVSKKLATLVIKNTLIGANDLVITVTVNHKADDLQEAREEAFEVDGNTTEEELDAIDKKIGDSFSNLIKFRRRQL